MTMFNGRIVYDEGNFDFSASKKGAYVEARVVENVVNCISPVCMRDSCTQMGEPYADLWDEKIQRVRPTFATFKKVAEGIWQYLGNCFLGETEERGFIKHTL